MEPLGLYLKQVREGKKLTIDKVIEDTFIMKKFILAIEDDDFSSFPGEAYLKGFLRNYGEYLGLDPADLISRYERIKMSETPSPTELLIPKPKAFFSRVLVVILIVLLVIALLAGVGAAVIMMNHTAAESSPKTIADVKSEKEKARTEKKKNLLIKEKKRDSSSAEDKSKVFTFETEADNFTVKKGEKISFTLDDKTYSIWVSELEPTVILESSAGGQLFLIANGFTNKFDVNGDKKEDLEVVLNYWTDKNATIGLKRIANSLWSDSNIDSEFFLPDTIEIIGESTDKSEIVAMISLSEMSYLKYQIDNNSEIENTFNAGAVLELKAKDRIILWMANSGVVSADFPAYNKRVVFGEKGKVDVKIIAWTKNNGNYSLQMSSLN
ncbi:MAG: helix-turn-helix domain-containing protein [Spirochaetales bacterium]|nr:helix-turn-helix domain-containing protein [Spirochaetales bacterium]